MNAQSNNSRPSRRDFLAGAAAAGLLGAGCMEKSRTQAAAKAIPVGVQLYSVRTECQKDLPGTIAKVARMGYQAVEFAGYYDYEKKAKDLRKLLDDNGIVCCGSHTQMDTLDDKNLAATIEFNQTLGNKFLIVPWLEAGGADPKASWLGYAERLNVLAEKVKPLGLHVGYHAHAHDFTPLNGELPWDILFGHTRKDVVMQMDTCNCMDGGGDPIAILKRYPGRSLTIHIKDYSATNKNAILGEGDVPWAEVFRFCETTGGTQWYVIEEEKDVYPPLVAVEKCLANYKKLRRQLA